MKKMNTLTKTLVLAAMVILPGLSFAQNVQNVAGADGIDEQIFSALLDNPNATFTLEVKKAFHFNGNKENFHFTENVDGTLSPFAGNGCTIVPKVNYPLDVEINLPNGDERKWEMPQKSIKFTSIDPLFGINLDSLNRINFKVSDPMIDHIECIGFNQNMGEIKHSVTLGQVRLALAPYLDLQVSAPSQY